MPSIGRPQRRRAGGDDRGLESDVLGALHGERVRVLEPADAAHPLDAVRLEEAGDAGGHLVDDRVLPLVGAPEVELRLRDVDAELGEAVGRLLHGVGRLHPRFRGDAADAQAGAAELGTPSRRRSPWRRVAPRGSRPDSRRGRRRATRTSQSIGRIVVRMAGGPAVPPGGRRDLHGRRRAGRAAGRLRVARHQRPVLGRRRVRPVGLGARRARARGGDRARRRHRRRVLGDGRRVDARAACRSRSRMSRWRARGGRSRRSSSGTTRIPGCC